MNLGKLKSFFAKPVRRRLALIISDEQFSGCLFQVSENKLEILSQSTELVADPAQMMAAAGRFLTKLSGVIAGSKVETVFGLPSNWIADKKVLPQYQQLLNKLTVQLNLSPVAFISAEEAVSFYLKRQREISDAVLVRADSKKLSISQISAGILETSQIILLSNNVMTEIKQVLESLPQLPSAFFIFGTANLTEAKSFVARVALQLNPSGEPAAIEILAEIVPEAVATATAADLGEIPKAQVTVDKESVDFGFVKGWDVATKVEPAKPVPVVPEYPPPVSELVTKPVESGKVGPVNFARIANLGLILAQLPFQIWSNTSGRKAALVLGAIVVIFGILFAVFWFLPSASVEIQAVSQGFEKDLLVTASSAVANVDTASGKIPAVLLETTLSASQKSVTTGKKAVGEKATGEVTVFNKTVGTKVFPGGTVIVGPGNGEFVFDSQVTVASRSATLEGITYGKAEVTVAASDIGPKFNIQADSEFEFAEFDSSLYSAHNEKAFSGGSQKEVSAVAAEDQKRLIETVVSDLKLKATEEFASKLAPTQKLIDDAITSEVAKQSFDKNVGDEASLLSVLAEVKFTATVYDKQDLNSIFNQQIEASIPEGFQLAPTAAEPEVKVKNLNENGDLVLAANLKFPVIPNFDLDQIRNDLVGKKPATAKAYLESLPGVRRVQIWLKPEFFPDLVKVMPRLVNRIKIDIAASEE